MENGQGRISQLDYLDYGCQLISEIYGKPNIGEWTNSDFIRLSNILYKKTRVQISPNTLKRIFGKIKTDARYYPQKATRDALVNYIGYPNWESFTNAQVVLRPTQGTLPSLEQQAAVGPAINIAIPVRKTLLKRNALKIMSGAMVLIILIILAAHYMSFETPVPTNVSIVCRNPVGGNPHSAIFALKGIDQESNPSNPFYIDFGDSRKMILNPNDTLVSHYYEEPGRYYAVLKQNKQVLGSATVYLQSAGWTATAKMMYDTTRVYPIDMPDLFRGKNSISAAEVSRSGIDTNRTFFIDFTNTQVTGMDGDNFDLVTKVQTSADRAGVRRSQVRLTIFGESARHRVDVMKPGCLHWTTLQISEVIKDGHVEGLDFLGADLRQGGTLRLTVKNKHARLYINGRQVYETTYSKPLKKIYGLDIMFAGVGTIHSVSLKDLKTQKEFVGNF